MPPENLDFDLLLGPIPGEKPAGESLRYEKVYDAIKEARREDAVLPMGEWQRDLKSADWNGLINHASEAIAKKSKDLQLGVWLVEALVKKHGFAGLRDGFRLLRELLENFWDGLFPEAEDGNLELRAGTLHWLDEKLPPSIKQVPITQGDNVYSPYHWEESRRVDNMGRQDPATIAIAEKEGKITGKKFDDAVAATPRLFYESLMQELNQARAELEGLEKIVDEKFGRETPSLLTIKDGLDDCHQLVNVIVKKKREEDPTYVAEAEKLVNGQEVAGVEKSGEPLAAPVMVWSGEPKNRDEAFQQLAVIAGYLKRSEPQHPVTYLLDRALRWTKMPLEEWLGEVIRHDDTLQHLRDTLGIKKP